MNMKLKALCWGAAIILVALGGSTGLMDKGTVATLTTILPLLAWMSITGRMNCPPTRG